MAIHENRNTNVQIPKMSLPSVARSGGLENPTASHPFSSSSHNYSNYTVELPTFSKGRHDRQRFVGGSDSGTSDDHLSVSEEPEEEPFGTQPLSSNRKRMRKIIRYSKQIMLAICWLIFTTFLMMYPEEEQDTWLLSIPPVKGSVYMITQNRDGINLILKLLGPFTKTSFKPDDQKCNEDNLLSFILQEVREDNSVIRNVSKLHNLQIINIKYLTQLPPVSMETIIENLTFDKQSKYQLVLYTNIESSLSLELSVVTSGLFQLRSILWGLAPLGPIYVYVMFDLVHRTFAAVISCSLAIGILAAANVIPAMPEICQFMYIDLIMSFFGITIIMEILAETGLQDYLAALSYELANGHIWPLLNVLFLASGSLSVIFGDIPLILFLAPICLRLCEIMHLNCTPVLSCLIIAINVGSTLTPISSVTNNLIASHPVMTKYQVNFGLFTLHMFPATLLILAQSYIHLRLQFIDSKKIGTKEPIQVERLKRLTRLWRKVSDRMGGYSLDERLARDTVDTRIRSLRKRLKRLGKMPIPPTGFEEKVKKLRDSFPLQKVALLVACLLSLAVTLLISILTLFTKTVNISTGWLAILAAVFTLSVCHYKDIEGVLSRIDWASMLFLSSLFILVHVLIKLGFKDSLGLFMERIITNAEEKHRLIVAILATTWISAGLSTTVNHAPIVSMMVDIITTICLNEDLKLPLMPMIWSVALGCCVGANGTIMGGVVNIACAGMASKHGYKVTYFDYLKIGFFVMVGNIIIATCYLLLAHVVCHWN